MCTNLKIWKLQTFQWTSKADCLTIHCVTAIVTPSDLGGDVPDPVNKSEFDHSQKVK